MCEERREAARLNPGVLNETRTLVSVDLESQSRDLRAVAAADIDRDAIVAMFGVAICDTIAQLGVVIAGDTGRIDLDRAYAVLESIGEAVWRERHRLAEIEDAPPCSRVGGEPVRLDSELEHVGFAVSARAPLVQLGPGGVFTRERVLVD